MPLPKAPQKPADKLTHLPTTASHVAITQVHSAPAALHADFTLTPPHLPTPQPTQKKRAADTRPTRADIHVTAAAKDAILKDAILKDAILKDAPPKDAAAKKHKQTVSQQANSPVPSRVPATPTAAGHRTKPKQQRDVKKLYVLDTNVLLHDPSSLFRFDEHDIFLPMVVLEELDNHKKGTTEVARHARQVSRTLDRLVNQKDANITTGVPLRATDNADYQGYLLFQTDIANNAVPQGLATGVPDHLILGEVERLATLKAPQPVVLVSKDINIRLKATVLGLTAQDYLNDNTTQDSDTLHTGWIDARDWNKSALTLVEQWQDNGIAHVKLSGNACPQLIMNSFVILPQRLDPDDFLGLGARVIENTHHTVVLKAVRDFTLPKHAVWGVQARNLEQNAALNLLTNPEIDCVSLLGQAGTGKTLLALAAGLAQVLDKRIYSDIILTRATVSVGDDIGFLPGTEEEKMAPWMGAVEDNLEVLLGNSKSNPSGVGGSWGQQASLDLVRSRIKIKSMAFMRGRTFQNKFVIVDEAQNLTPKQMKTLITRAGPGTKFVCLGNLAQIDTPYLTEHSSGLGYVIERFKNWAHGGHITLARGERSRLAEFASEIL